MTDPKIQDDRDIIVRITTTAICGSDLHLLDGFIPTMKSGDVLGHEPMGIVAEVGKGIKNLRVGDRVVVPFTISCGSCYFCQKGLYSCCDVSNPNAEIARKLMGHSPAGLFGYSHMREPSEQRREGQQPNGTPATTEQDHRMKMRGNEEDAGARATHGAACMRTLQP